MKVLQAVMVALLAGATVAASGVMDSGATAAGAPEATVSDAAGGLAARQAAALLHRLSPVEVDAGKWAAPVLPPLPPTVAHAPAPAVAAAALLGVHAPELAGLDGDLQLGIAWLLHGHHHAMRLQEQAMHLTPEQREEAQALADDWPLPPQEERRLADLLAGVDWETLAMAPLAQAEAAEIAAPFVQASAASQAPILPQEAREACQASRDAAGLVPSVPVVGVGWDPDCNQRWDPSEPSPCPVMEMTGLNAKAVNTCEGLWRQAMDASPEEVPEPTLQEDPTVCGVGFLYCDRDSFRLAIGDHGRTEHREEYLFVVDLGGDDVYFNNVAGHGPGVSSGFFLAGVNLVNIDMDGNDTYTRVVSTRLPPMAVYAASRTIGTFSLMLDRQGDDLYHVDAVRDQTDCLFCSGSIYAMSASVGANNVFYDAAGDDVYLLQQDGFTDQMGEGSGWTGASVYIDAGGNDFRQTLDFNKLRGGYGTIGSGVFLDLGGWDTYIDNKPGLVRYLFRANQNALQAAGQDDAVWYNPNGGGFDFNGNILSIQEAVAGATGFDPPDNPAFGADLPITTPTLELRIGELAAPGTRGAIVPGDEATFRFEVANRGRIEADATVTLTVSCQGDEDCTAEDASYTQALALEAGPDGDAVVEFQHTVPDTGNVTYTYTARIASASDHGALLEARRDNDVFAGRVEAIRLVEAGIEAQALSNPVLSYGEALTVQLRATNLGLLPVQATVLATVHDAAGDQVAQLPAIDTGVLAVSPGEAIIPASVHEEMLAWAVPDHLAPEEVHTLRLQLVAANDTDASNNRVDIRFIAEKAPVYFHEDFEAPAACRAAATCDLASGTWSHTLVRNGQLGSSPWRHDGPTTQPFDDIYSVSRQENNDGRGLMYGYNMGEPLFVDADGSGDVSPGDVVMNNGLAGLRVPADHPAMGRALRPVQDYAQLMWLDDVRTEGWPQGLYLDPQGRSASSNGIYTSWGAFRLSGPLFGYAIKRSEEFGYSDPDPPLDTLWTVDATGDGPSHDDPLYIAPDGATAVADGHIRVSPLPGLPAGSIVEAAAGDVDVGRVLATALGPADELHYVEDGEDGVFTSGRDIYGGFRADLDGPVIDLTGAYRPVLSFTQYFYAGSSFNGQPGVEVATRAGSIWTPFEKVWERRDNTAGWDRVNVDLSPFAGKEIRVRFVAESTSSNTQDVSYHRWFVDDVLITTHGATNLAVAAIVEPLTEFNGNRVGPGDTVDVTIRVRNQGLTVRQDVPVRLEVFDASGAPAGGGLALVDRLLPAGDPAGGDLQEVVIPWDVPLGPGRFTLVASLDDPADILATDDTRSLTVTSSFVHDPAVTEVTITPDGQPGQGLLAGQPRTVQAEVHNRGNVAQQNLPVRITVHDPFDPEPLLDETLLVSVEREQRVVVEVPFTPPAPGQYLVQAESLLRACSEGALVCDAEPANDAASAPLRAYDLLLDAQPGDFAISGEGTLWAAEDGLRFGGPVQGQTGYLSDSRTVATIQGLDLRGLRSADVILRHSHDFEQSHDGGLVQVRSARGTSPVPVVGGLPLVTALGNQPGFTGSSPERVDRLLLGRAEAYAVPMIRHHDAAEELDGFVTAGKPVGRTKNAEDRWTIDTDVVHNGAGSLYNGGNGMTHADTAGWIDLRDAGFTGAHLQLWQRYDLSAPSAQAQVLAQRGSTGAWHQLEPTAQTTPAASAGATLDGLSGGDLVPEWIHTTYDLTAFLGDRVKIRFDTLNDARQFRQGSQTVVDDGEPVHWWIDDIQVRALRVGDDVVDMGLLAATDGSVQDRTGWRVEDLQVYALPYRHNIRVGPAQLDQDRPHAPDSDIRFIVPVSNMGARPATGLALQGPATTLPLPDIGPGEETVMLVDVPAAALGLGQHTVAFAVAPDEQDEFPSDNTDLVLVEVSDQVDAVLADYHVAPTTIATGETSHVTFEVRNEGIGELRDVIVTGYVARPGEPDQVVLEERMEVLEPGAKVPLTWSFEPPQPGRYAFRTQIEASGQSSGTYPARDVLGNDLAQRIVYVDQPFRVLTDDLDDPLPGWSHASRAMLPSPDLWHVDDTGIFGDEGHTPPAVWASHDPETGRYASHADNVLTTPLIDLTASEQGKLVLRQRYQFHDPDEGSGLPRTLSTYGDGGWIEYSVDEGASWHHLDHDYPGQVAWQTQEVPGYVQRSGWHEEAIDLDRFAGQAVKLRFRLVSDSTAEAAGWALDDIRATSPVRVGFSPDLRSTVEDTVTKHFTHTIHNLGPLTDTFDLRTTGTLPAGWQARILVDGATTDNVTIDGFSQREITLEVTTVTPQNAPPSEVLVPVEARSRADPSRGASVDTLLRFDPSPKPDLRILRDAIQLEPDAPMSRAPVLFSIVVSNEGTVDATDVPVRVVDVFGSEQRILHEGVIASVPALASGVINTGIVEFQATLPEPGEHLIRVEVDPADHMREFDETDNVAQRLVFLAPFSAPDVHVEELALSQSAALLGDTVRVVAPIRNEGTETALDVQVAFFKDGAMVHRTVVPVLAPGATTLVSAETGAFPMGERHVLVTTETARDPDPDDDQAETTFFVRGFALHVEAEEPLQKPAGPGTAAQFTIHVRNDGNAVDVATVRVREARLDAAVDPVAAEIQPGQSRTFTVSLQPRQDTPVGMLEVPVKVASLGNPLVVQAVDIAVDVEALRGLAVEPPPTIAVAAGKSANATFLVRNTGNEELAVGVDAQLPRAWRTVTTPTFVLGAGAERQLVVRVTAPLHASSGLHDLNVTFAAEGVPSILHQVPVAAFGDQALRIEVPPRAHVPVGEESRIPFIVHNDAPRELAASLRVAGGAGRAEPASLVLPAGGQAAASLVVHPAQEGTTHLHVLALAQGASAAGSVAVDAAETGLETVSITMTPRYPQEGDTVTVTATMRNGGGRPSPPVDVTLLVGGDPVQTQTVEAMAVAQDSRVTFTFQADGTPVDLALRHSGRDTEPLLRIDAVEDDRRTPFPAGLLLAALAALAATARRRP